MGKYGMFETKEELDAFIAWRDKTIGEEAERLKGIGIKDQDDFIDKYSALCNLWETGEVADEDTIILTSDSAREFADKVLQIMYGGPWRNTE
jgi:hypothetical protein